MTYLVNRNQRKITREFYPGDVMRNHIQATGFLLEDIKKNNVQTPWFVLRSPELGKPFQEFYEACIEKGVLDRKTKELLMTALAAVFRCSHNTEEHIKAALDAGASKEEITEVLLIAAAEGAATQLAWQKELYKKYLI
jgi:AhpD family alkylhydroperoxidase